jgi:hypothetical protein
MKSSHTGAVHVPLPEIHPRARDSRPASDADENPSSSSSSSSSTTAHVVVDVVVV